MKYLIHPTKLKPELIIGCDDGILRTYSDEAYKTTGTPILFYLDQDQRAENLKANRVDMEDPTSHSAMPNESRAALYSVTDVLWARDCLQYIVSFTEHASLVIYERVNPEQLIMEIQIISHSGEPDGKRGKSKHRLPSVRVLDDEAGTCLLEYDRQWSVFSLGELIAWGMANKRGAATAAE